MSVTVYSEIVYPTFVKRRYKVVLTNNLGEDKECILGMYDHQPSNDGSEVEASLLKRLSEQEAERASELDEVIDEKEFASIELVALAFLRGAYSTFDSYRAYKKYERFNDYRVSKGWSLAQVVAGLASVGLEQEEWDLMLARYQYLSLAARVTAMENYQIVSTNDPRG